MVKITGKTIIEHIIERIRQVAYVSDIILATTTDTEDDALVDETQRLGIRVYRGSKNDVVGRLWEAVDSSQSETILKVNGNYPLFDPYVANDLVNAHFQGDYDLSYSEHFQGTVYGTGCFIFQKRILSQLNTKMLTAEQRDAGLLCFYQNSSMVKLKKFRYANPRPHYSVCFDTDKDLELIEFIFKNIARPYTKEIIKLLDNNPILVRLNKKESIQEVGLEKLYLFPEKFVTLSRRDLFEIDNSYPINIELSLTDRCNFNCVWCSDKNIRSRINGDIKLGTLKKLFADLKQGGTKGIVIEGGGEPTIHKNFADIVNLANSLGFGIGLITNGSIEIERDIADNLEWIRVSLDASNPEEQKLLKNTDTFEKVISNIKRLCSSKATIGVGYVVTSKNIEDIEFLILRLRNIGVRYIQFRPVIDHEDLDTNVDLSYLKRYQNSKFYVIADGMHQNLIDGNDNLPCIAHSLTSVIASDGSVYLCGRLNIHEWIESIGNINKQPFKDIWLGKKRREQSMMVLNPKFCKKYCPRCRLTKFNQLFNRLYKTKTKNFI